MGRGKKAAPASDQSGSENESPVEKKSKKGGKKGKKKTTKKSEKTEKRKPSAYNQYVKEEMAKIKASDPAMPHREAFKLAAARWKTAPENKKNNPAAVSAAKPEAAAVASGDDDEEDEDEK